MALRNVTLAFSKDINNPTELSDRELNTLVTLVGDPTINLELSGYIRKNSIYKSQYKALVAYAGLAGDRQVQYDVLVDDIYEIYPVKTQINEGEDTKFTVTGTVPASALKYTLSHNIAISYAPAEATELQLKNIIQERIKVVNGRLVCEAAQENASWTDVVTITTVPMGMEDEPNAVKTCQVVVQAIAVTDLKISGIDDVDSGATLVLNMNLVPANNTKTFNPNSVVWSTNGGTINQTGMLTAPNTQGRYQVTVGLTLYSTGTFRDFVEHSESFVVTGALFSAEQNPIVFEAMKQAYPEFADRTAISTKDVKNITNVTTLWTILRDETRAFSFDEFEYFESVTELPSTVTMANSKITSISFPKNINTISGNTAGKNNYFGAFGGCDLLTKINFGGVKIISGATIPNAGFPNEIHLGAFSGCTALVDINFGEVETITGGIFNDGSQMNKFGAFYGCSSLTSINLKNVKVLGHGTGGRHSNNISGAFAGCTSLREVQMPKLETMLATSGTSMPGIFRDCPIEVLKFPNSFKSIGNSALSGTKCNIIDFSESSVTIFPCQMLNATTQWSSGLFAGSSASTIIFPEGEISFQTTAQDRGYNTWVYGCNSLTTLNFNNSIITEIPTYWLSADSTPGLKHIYIPTNGVIPCGTNALSSITYIFVKDEYVDAFKASSAWESYANKIYPVSTMASYGWTA